MRRKHRHIVDREPIDLGRVVVSLQGAKGRNAEIVLAEGALEAGDKIVERGRLPSVRMVMDGVAWFDIGDEGRDAVLSAKMLGKARIGRRVFAVAVAPARNADLGSPEAIHQLLGAATAITIKNAAGSEELNRDRCNMHILHRLDEPSDELLRGGSNGLASL